MAIAFPHVGAAIRYVRQTLRLKMEGVAQDAGCSPSNLSRIENGLQRPSLPLLESIAHALGTTVSDLYQWVESNRSPTAQPPAAGRLSTNEWLLIRSRLDGLPAARRQEVLVQLEVMAEPSVASTQAPLVTTQQAS